MRNSSSFRIIDEGGNLLYDNRRFPYEDPYVELRGVDVWLFLLYFTNNWPNHWIIMGYSKMWIVAA
jgi:hypothetical protein